MPQTSQVQVLVIGHSDALSRLRRELPIATDILGSLVLDWDSGDEDDWVDLVRLCHRHGCAPIPVQDSQQALRVSRAFLTPV